MNIYNEKSPNLNIDYYKSLFSTEKYKKIPIVSLEQSVKPLIKYLPHIETYVKIVKQKCLNPFDNLTCDESASIMIYSIIWKPFNECLYILLNSILQTLDENKLQPWLLYLKLLFTALIHLPSNNLTVYRGCKLNLNKQYHINDIILWWDLSLCTSSIEYLEKKSKLHTIFIIKCNTIKNIQKHCYYQLNHFLLYLPATKFQVINCYYKDNDDLYIITLKEIESSFILHSFNDKKIFFLNKQISLNIFQRFCLLFKKSKNQSLISTKHYRNPSLEHRIIENGHSWIINLDKQNLIDQDMKIVVKYAIIKKSCKRIRLRHNYITAYGSSILSESLINNTILESLDLCNNQLFDLGLQFLSLAIVYSNIKTLNLESNNITEQGALYLAQMLKDNRTLTELYLSKNHLGDRGVQLIANVLCEQSDKEVSIGNQSTLQHLYLGQNDITDEGLKYLSNMLKTNQTLTWLWLTDNEISNQGIEFLSNILIDYNVTLEWLFLNSNKLINDTSIDYFIQLLKRNNTLKTLYINNCNLSENTKRILHLMIKTKKDFDLEV